MIPPFLDAKTTLYYGISLFSFTSVFKMRNSSSDREAFHKYMKFQLSVRVSLVCTSSFPPSCRFCAMFTDVYMTELASVQLVSSVSVAISFSLHF